MPAHHAEVPSPDPGSFVLDLENSAAAGKEFTPETLRQLLVTTRVTLVADFLTRGRTLDDYRSAIWMYLDRYVKEGGLDALAKAVLKSVSLRDHLLRDADGAG